jgi:hypothetical protein
VQNASLGPRSLPFIHLTPIPNLFDRSDSEIANDFACGRTKSTQIDKRAVAPDLMGDVVQTCRSQPFTLMCDESNAYGNDKCWYCLHLAVMMK